MTSPSESVLQRQKEINLQCCPQSFAFNGLFISLRIMIILLTRPSVNYNVKTQWEKVLFALAKISLWHTTRHKKLSIWHEICKQVFLIVILRLCIRAPSTLLKVILICCEYNSYLVMAGAHKGSLFR